MTIKEAIATVYFTLSLFALVCEPTGESKFTFVVTYYTIAIVNFGVAAFILNRVIKSTDANTTAKI